MPTALLLFNEGKPLGLIAQEGNRIQSFLYQPIEPRLPSSRVRSRTPRRQAGKLPLSLAALERAVGGAAGTGTGRQRQRLRTPKSNVYHLTASTSSSSLPSFGASDLVAVVYSPRSVPNRVIRGEKIVRISRTDR